MSYVLDSSAMIALLTGEAGAGVVEAVLIEEEARCYAHAAQMCEMFYDALRQSSEENALAAVAAIEGLGVEIRADFDPQFWQEVGRFKVKYKASFADCIGLALAKRLDADFLTADRHELDAIENQGEIGVVFIR